MNIFEKILELQKKRIPAAVVIVIRTKGSVPREAGSKMLVEKSGKIHGTIGGGSVENLIIKEAIDVLKSGTPRTIKHDLFDEEGKDTGMICGGEMEFYIEPLITADQLFIFGAGHIGYHLARIAKLLGFNCSIIDDRQEFANIERFPNAADILNKDFVETAGSLNFTKADYIVIITRNHDLDYEILKKELSKPSYYLGLIGSKNKKQEIFARLKDIDGFEEDEINKIHCPIGLDIGSETPEEIALSIMAEIVEEKRR